MPISEAQQTARIVMLVRSINIAYTAARRGMTSDQIDQLLGAGHGAVFALMQDHMGAEFASKCLTAVAKAEADSLSGGAPCTRH